MAGLFYESEPEALRETLKACFLDPLGPGSLPPKAPAHAASLTLFVCPHAGYVYSGACAAHVYSQLSQIGFPPTLLLLGPNHRGNGFPFALYDGEGFRTPLGVMPIDRETTQALRQAIPLLRPDLLAHQEEHSLEVQIPFLQFCQASSQIVPILFGTHPFDRAYDPFLEELGVKLADFLQRREAAVILSTDLSHYFPIEQARTLDHHAIRALLSGDPEYFLATVREYEINMCGAVPVAVGLYLARALALGEGRLLQYYTSGDVPLGDPQRVVGYAACMFGVS